jgi:CBS domain-containing protein
MRIRDIMSAPAITCRTNDTLDTPARLMWEHDCGAIPVTDDEGQIAGMVTDRDICIATYTKGSAPQAIRVSDAMAPRVYSCQAGDPVDAVERVMSEHQIHRMPIVDDEHRLVGFISMNDIARAAAVREDNGTDREVVQTMAAIGQPRRRDTPAGQRAVAGQARAV